MQSDWKTPAIDDFFEVVSQLNKKELECFFRDVATMREISEMSKRWKAAQMISQNIPYRTIAKETSLSTATVTRVAEWLNIGTGGYQIALTKTHHAH